MDLQNVLDQMYQERTLVFGHQGAKAYAPTNTIPAFELAVAQRADGVELDVHLSKDKYPVILHDFTVDATTNGKGYARDMTLAQLKELDAGGWFGESFQGVQIPTLDEVFEAVGRKLYINVEIKSETEETDGVEQIVADTIAEFELQQRVIVSSFNPYTLKRFRKIMPDVAIGFLYMSDGGWNSLMEDVPHEARHPHHSVIDRTFMAWAKSKGYRVNTWTVNEPERAVELRDLRVDCIISDNPDVIIKALQG
jgi:glycerophosphoryl diester phosphodiesterase